MTSTRYQYLSRPSIAPLCTGRRPFLCLRLVSPRLEGIQIQILKSKTDSRETDWMNSHTNGHRQAAIVR